MTDAMTSHPIPARGETTPQASVCQSTIQHGEVPMSDTTVTIILDGEPVVIAGGIATGRDIKIAGRVDPSRLLWPDGSSDARKDQPIADDDRVTVADGARFMSVPAGMF